MEHKESSFEFYFDIVCPFAYIASTQVEAIAKRTKSTVVLKPVLLGGLFKANEVKIGPNGSFADTMNEVKREYMRVDMLRMVKERGAKLVWPENHPRRSVLALRVLLYLTSEESPLKGSSEWQKVSMWKMVTALYEGYWQKSLDISSADSLAHILTSLGYSNPLALISAANESEVIKEALTSRTQAGVEKGLFGVPSFFIATQPDRLIYGQDNLEQLEELLGGASHLQKIIDTFDLKRFQAPSLPPSPTSTSITPLFPSLPLYATTFYMDYSSPYTYLAWLRIQSLFGPSNIHCEPVLLGALFKGVGQHNTPMATMSPARQAWSSQELLFQLSTLNAPFQWASRFPLRTILPLRMTIAAGPNTAEGRKLVSAFFHAFWALDQDPTDSSVCINIATQCGLDGQAIYTKANLPETKKALQTQTDVALQHGVFGLPMMAVHRPEKTEWFWGNDRLLWAFQSALQQSPVHHSPLQHSTIQSPKSKL